MDRHQGASHWAPKAALIARRKEKEALLPQACIAIDTTMSTAATATAAIAGIIRGGRNPNKGGIHPDRRAGASIRAVRGRCGLPSWHTRRCNTPLLFCPRKANLNCKERNFFLINKGSYGHSRTSTRLSVERPRCSCNCVHRHVDTGTETLVEFFGWPSNAQMYTNA
jgi:hypothetical protein